MRTRQVAKKASSGISGAKPPARKASRKVAKKAAKKPKAAKGRQAPDAAPAKKTGKAAKASKPRAVSENLLTKADFKKFRQLLLAKRRDLLGDLTGIEAEALRRGGANSSSDLSTLPTHPADIGSDNYEQEFTLGLLESERLLLKEIDEALVRIEEGTYGMCLIRGEAIGKPRLTARPWAKYCIDCARLIEKGLVNPEEDEARNEPVGEDDEEEEDSAEEEGEQTYEYEDEPYESEDDD
jgi:RNA polymerase-binding protein DksA